MFWSFLILVAVFAIAYFVWRIVDMLPDFIFRLSEIQRDLAEIRRQMTDSRVAVDGSDDEPAPAVTRSSTPAPAPSTSAPTASTSAPTASTSAPTASTSAPATSTIDAPSSTVAEDDDKV